MKAQGLYTTYEDESAYELSSFSIDGIFELHDSVYFVCSLSQNCNLGIDKYPAYAVPGKDLIFLSNRTDPTDLKLSRSDSYLMFEESIKRENSGIVTAFVGEFAATNAFTVSVADAINAGLLSPGLTVAPLSAGEATLVLGRGSSLSSLQTGDYVQLAIRAVIVRDLTDPQTAALEGTALLAYLLESDYRYISLKVTQVIEGEGERDVLYLSEEEWGSVCRSDGTYRSLDIYLFGDTDLVSLIGTSSRLRKLIGNWQTVENRVTLVEHNRLWQAVTTGACNYPAIIRILSVLLILLLPLLWCSPQMVHFSQRQKEFSVMSAVGRTGGQLKRMVAAECLLVTLAAGIFVALLCPFSVLCVQAAIYFLELPFETSGFDTRAYLFMIVFVMLCSALSFLAASRRIAPRAPKKTRKGGNT